MRVRGWGGGSYSTASIVRSYLDEQVGPVLPEELDEVLVLEQRALLDDLQVGLRPLQQVHLLEQEVADLGDGLNVWGGRCGVWEVWGEGTVIKSVSSLQHFSRPVA